jgi:hypothetical protein
MKQWVGAWQIPVAGQRTVKSGEQVWVPDCAVLQAAHVYCTSAPIENAITTHKLNPSRCMTHSLSLEPAGLRPISVVSPSILITGSRALKRT